MTAMSPRTSGSVVHEDQKAESRLSISEVPQEISRIFFGEPKPRYF